ncbi:MAG: OB-fold domain-containing protein [Alphaproteobacteria bacterium]|nr:OB-fold domain-containing protein [Alphaproteobacteria bacterium]
MAEPAQHARPVPVPTHTSAPFWDAGKRGKFMLQYDPAAKKYQFFPRPVSIYSGSDKLEWREASGRGTLVARTNVQVPLRGFEKLVPFVLAAVNLEEGVRVVARLMGVSYCLNVLAIARPGDRRHVPP